LNADDRYHVSCLGWSPDGKRLGAGGSYREPDAQSDDFVRIWDAATMAEMVGFPGFVSRGIPWAPDGRHLAARDGRPNSVTANIWDAVAQQRVAVLESLDSQDRLLWSPDGQRLAVTIWEGAHIEIWRGGQSLSSWTREAVLSDWESTRDPIWCPDGTNLAWIPKHRSGKINAERNAVRVWNAYSRSDVSVSALGSFIRTIRWHPGGNQLAALAFGKELRFWNSATWLDVTIHQTEEGTCMEWSPDGKRLAVGYEDGSVRVLDCPREVR
jgi:WD40 repeat protein